MPILFQINSTANWGSTGRIAEEIGQTAMSQGWTSYLAYGRNMTPSSLLLFKVGTRWDIYSHVFESRLFDRHGFASRNATRNLIQQITRIHPDIIHLHNIHGYYLNYPILFEYLAKTDVPVVWTMHDCWVFTGHCANYDYVDCRKWLVGCHDCPQRKSYPASLFYDRSARNYADKRHWFSSVKQMTLVPVSEWLATEVKRSFLGHYPVQVIHNGIDTSIFKPQTVRKETFGLEGKFVVLGVASIWTQHKGLDDFIKLRALLPDDCVVFLIGLNNKQIASLPDGIVGISRTNDVHELAAYYSVADVFVNPTWEDNFPTVNLESLSCGTPVITYRTGGSIEAVDDVTGYIVKKRDVRGLADRVLEVKARGKRSYQDLCRCRAVNCFEKKERYLEYITLYEKMLAEKMSI